MTSIALSTVPQIVDTALDTDTELDQDTPLGMTPVWDLYADASGNIATVTSYAAMAQDVACRCRVFLGELWYNTQQGIPYDTKILNKWPPKSLVSSQLVNQALAVPGVVKAAVKGLTVTNRQLTGSIEFTDAQGVTESVQF